MERPKPMSLTELLQMEFIHDEHSEEQEYRRGYCDGFFAAVDALENRIPPALFDALMDFHDEQLEAWKAHAPEAGSDGRRAINWPPEYVPSLSRAKPSAVAGEVYIIRMEGTTHYKIGCTADVTKRLQALQGGSPRLLVLVWKNSFTDMRQTERAFHQYFKDYRTQGEWFDIPKSVMQDFLRTRQIEGE